MSRIDEALARARRNLERPAPAPVPAIPASIPFDGPQAWPEEAEEAPAAPLPEEPVNGRAAAPVAGPGVDTGPSVDGVEIDINQWSYAQLSYADKLIVGNDVSAGTIEQFRRLAAQLYLAQAERETRTVMVVSALPGEGKTLTAANLALTLSQSYKRQVLLVDGDLRRPGAHQLFQVPNMSGLNDGIRSEVDRKVPVIRISETLSLLTAGRPDPDPMSVLSSERMRRVLDEARERFEWVIVDTPPLAILTDAHLLASLVDVAVLVVQAGRTPAAAIQRVIDAIGRERIAGVVLNRVSREQVLSGYADYYDGSARDV